MNTDERRALIERDLRALHPDLTRILIVGNVATIYVSGVPKTGIDFEPGTRTRELIEVLELLG